MLDIKSLQNSFALHEFLERQGDDTRVSLEQLVAKKEQIKVKIYQEQRHPRPHVHVDYGFEHHSASYAIDTGERLSGNLQGKYDRIVSAWILENVEPLKKIWSDLQMGGAGEDFSQELSAL